METCFYDKVAEKFGRYSSGIKAEKEFSGEDPEVRFKSELLQVAGPQVEALDVGCADGRFTLSIAPNFKKVTAIDISDGMLAAAKRLQTEKGIKNVDFRKVDLFHNQYFSEIFGVIYSRRGPTDYTEFERLLIPGGSYVGIGIGEEDAKELKEVFGRGQGYGKWNESVMEKTLKELRDVRLTVRCAEISSYTEYYKSSVDLSRFLESVPIFKDYDPVKDRDNLAQYIAKYKTEKGIALHRQRIVIVAQKP